MTYSFSLLRPRLEDTVCSIWTARSLTRADGGNERALSEDLISFKWFVLFEIAVLNAF